jgi:hypothetical protein
MWDRSSNVSRCWSRQSLYAFALTPIIDLKTNMCVVLMDHIVITWQVYIEVFVAVWAIRPNLCATASGGRGKPEFCSKAFVNYELAKFQWSLPSLTKRILNNQIRDVGE